MSHTTPKDSKKAKKKPWSRLFFRFGLMGLLAIALISTIATTTGARYTLTCLGDLIGFHVHGVSGTLINHINIEHLEFSNENVDIVADDVRVQWTPSAFFKRTVQLDLVSVNALDVTIKQRDTSANTPLTMPTSLQLPWPLKSLIAEKAALNRLQLRFPTSVEAITFSRLNAHLTIDAARYTLSFSGASPWGSVALGGHIETVSPFQTQGDIAWQGLASDVGPIKVPAIAANGGISGDFRQLQLNVQRSIGNGHILAVLTPFNALPLELLRIDWDSLNPAKFYDGAPHADLRLKADIKTAGQRTTPTLEGHFSIQNTKPMRFNEGGIPLSSLESDLTLSETGVLWDNTRIELASKHRAGRMTMSGRLASSTSLAVDHQFHLPDLNASIHFKNVNALDIDSRLGDTRLSGDMRVDTIKEGWQFAVDLDDQRFTNRDMKLSSNLRYSHDQVVTIDTLLLRSNQSMLKAKGYFAINDPQTFDVKGSAVSFNPRDWIDVAPGHIAANFAASGQLQQGWAVAAKVSDLKGQFAGLDVQGAIDLSAKQNGLLSIQTLDINWGKNTLTAKGRWPLSAAHATTHNQSERLHVALALPDLHTVIKPVEKIFPILLNGSLFAQGDVLGHIHQPSGSLHVDAEQLAIDKWMALESLHASVALAEGVEGKFEGNVEMTELALGSLDPASTDSFTVQRLNADLSGVRNMHQVAIKASLPRKSQFELLAKGEWRNAPPNTRERWQWKGHIQQMNLMGAADLQLLTPFVLHISDQSVRMDAATWQGKLGRVSLNELNGSPNQFSVKGEWKDLRVIDAIKLLRRRSTLSGDLQLDAQWALSLGDHATGEMSVQRQSGDIIFQSISGGYAQSYPLGLQHLTINAHVEPGARLAHSPIAVQVNAQGQQLGQLSSTLRSALKKTDNTWGLANDAPLSGHIEAQINDIQWLSQLFGPDTALRGELQAKASISGTLAHPDYSAKLSGQHLQYAATDLGMLLPNGVLEASLEKTPGKNTQLQLETLQFSQTIKAPPKHPYLNRLSWLGETGVITASGAIDVESGHGSIKASWQRFPFLQANEGWLVASGSAELTESDKFWKLVGLSVADAAYFSVPKDAPPKLSSDVTVLKPNERHKASHDAPSTGLQSSIDFTVKTGDNFIFVGRGLDTRLSGDIRLRVDNNGPLVTTGAIHTDGGVYEGYGQELAIENGVLSFQGALDNPSLNVRALRKGLPVEAGVDIVGTIAKPEVRLVSIPDVPDQDKLSWMILGRSSDQIGGSDAGVLMAAANAIFGGSDGNSIPRRIASVFGLDDISVSASKSASESQLPSQTVAGTIANSTSSDQVFSVGKRVTPDLILSIERSLTEASNGLKLTWKLTRRFSIIGRAGADTSIDGQYLISFE